MSTADRQFDDESEDDFDDGSGEPIQIGRMLFFRKPRCPLCGSPDLKAQRGQHESDGSTTRFVKCGGCETNWEAVFE